MMKKRGMELSLNTIVIAALVLVVLIVMWIIYVKFIGQSAGRIGDVGEEAGQQVNDVTWCMPTVLKGQSCDVDEGESCSGHPIYSAKSDPKSCSITCKTGLTRKIRKDAKPESYTCKGATSGGSVDGLGGVKYVCCG